MRPIKPTHPAPGATDKAMDGYFAALREYYRGTLESAFRRIADAGGTIDEVAAAYRDLAPELFTAEADCHNRRLAAATAR